MKNITIYRDGNITTIYWHKLINYIYNATTTGVDEYSIWFEYVNKYGLMVNGKLSYSEVGMNNLLSLMLTIKDNEHYYIREKNISYETPGLDIMDEKSIIKKINYSMLYIYDKKIRNIIKEEYMSNFKEAENMFKVCFGV